MANRSAFISMLWPHAVEAANRTGIDPRLIVAQAAHETGWGKHVPNNNYFGIKSHGKSGGGTFATTEVINGKPVTVRDSFRGYSSPAASVQGYADFMLENPRYSKMRRAQGLDAQLQALGASGYATDPNYSASVGAIAKSIPSNYVPSPTNPNEALGGDSMVARNHAAEVAAATNTPIVDPGIDGAVASIWGGGDAPGGGAQVDPRDLQEQKKSPLQGILGALSQLGDGPSHARMGPMGDARQSGSGLLEYLAQGGNPLAQFARKQRGILG